MKQLHMDFKSFFATNKFLDSIFKNFTFYILKDSYMDTHIYIPFIVKWLAV